MVTRRLQPSVPRGSVCRKQVRVGDWKRYGMWDFFEQGSFLRAS